MRLSRALTKRHCMVAVKSSGNGFRAAGLTTSGWTLRAPNSTSSHHPPSPTSSAPTPSARSTPPNDTHPSDQPFAHFVELPPARPESIASCFLPDERGTAQGRGLSAATGRGRGGARFRRAHPGPHRPGLPSPPGQPTRPHPRLLLQRRLVCMSTQVPPTARLSPAPAPNCWHCLSSQGCPVVAFLQSRKGFLSTKHSLAVFVPGPCSFVPLHGYVKK